MKKTCTFAGLFSWYDLNFYDNKSFIPLKFFPAQQAL